MDNEPLLSVAMITYKHEAYIKQAVEGVLMQETNFEFHLIISDDCSPDTTAQIVQDIIDNHPNGYRVKYFRHEKNMGMQPNGLFALQQCKGKYVAVCEGDDYWTDPLKLQKQVDFLETNNDFVLCFHKVNELNEFNSKSTNTFPNITEDHSYKIYDYILNNLTATCSMVFVKKYFKAEHWFNSLPFGDLGVVLVLMKNSNKRAMVLKDIMGTYRVHQGGVHGNLQQNPSKLIEAYRQHLVFARIIQEKLLFEKIYSKYFLKKKIQTYTQLNQLYKKENIYNKGLLNKMILSLLKMKYRILY
jgi:glycosyltransferase involved in cell wall biosynthesis